jgi:hypothetical protein
MLTLSSELYPERKNEREKRKGEERREKTEGQKIGQSCSFLSPHSGT